MSLEPIEKISLKSPVILNIAVPAPLRSSFDYLLPDRYLPTDLQPGMRIKIPFGKRTTVGILLSTSSDSDFGISKLKQVFEIIDEKSLLSPELMSLAMWASQYYQHPIGDVLYTILPAALRGDKPAKLQHEMIWQLTNLGNSIDLKQLKRATKQIKALQQLRELQQPLDSQQLTQLEISSTTIKSLQNKELVEKVAVTPHYQTQSSPLSLTDEQQLATDTIIQSFQCFKTFLLQGITGSGKTEVYLQTIEAAISQGKQALVLVPEIGLTPQTIQRFQKRCPVPILALHSGLTNQQRLQSWLKSQQSQPLVVIGTRSAIFTPMDNLGIIIIDEEHDLSFKQQDGFRYSARDLAIIRASKLNIPVVLGTATPSLETLYNANKGRYQLLPLTQRPGSAKLPSFQVIDLRAKKLDEGLSKALIDSISQQLKQGHQVLIFLNRRGYAPVLMCHQCGWFAECRRCDAKMTYHASTRHLHCHHCSNEHKALNRCPNCQSPQLLPLGLGTQRLEMRLAQLFPQIPVIRIDRDSTRRKDSLKNLLQSINDNEPAILIGTQMLAKGHHFPNITLAAILDVDSGLFSVDFRASERLGQLITQVAGRAGRGDRAGTVILQTHHPDNHDLVNLLRYGYQKFANDTLQQRIAANLPPYSYAALIRAEATDAQQPMAFLQQALTLARDILTHSVELLGPVPAPMEKKAGRYRAQLMLQSQQRPNLHKLLPDYLKRLEKLHLSRKVRWSIDIDPVELC